MASTSRLIRASFRSILGTNLFYSSSINFKPKPCKRGAESRTTDLIMGHLVRAEVDDRHVHPPNPQPLGRGVQPFRRTLRHPHRRLQMLLYLVLCFASQGAAKPNQGGELVLFPSESPAFKVRGEHIPAKQGDRDNGLDDGGPRLPGRRLSEIAAGLLHRVRLLLRRISCATSALDEGQKVGVDDIRMGCGHAVREVLVDLQRPIPKQLGGQWTGVCEGDDLIVLAVHHQHGDFDLL